MYYKTLETIFTKYSSSFNSRLVKSKEIIISQGNKPNSVYWVKSGTVKAFNVNKKGQEFLIALFGPGEIFGELEFFHDTEYYASIEAITDCEIMFISFNDFESIISEENEFLKSITSKLAQRLISISERTSSYSFFPLEYLVAKYLLNEYKSKESTQLIINKNNLANYFGTNLRSINRILKNLSDKKKIVINSEQIKINSTEQILEIIKQYT